MRLHPELGWLEPIKTGPLVWAKCQTQDPVGVELENPHPQD